MKTDSKELLSKDQDYVWHDLRRHNPEAPPTVGSEAEGVWFTDIDGKKYLDAMAGMMCVNVGYGREEIAQVAYDQMKALSYFPLIQSHVPAIQLAEKLNEWLDDDYLIFFSNSGSEANETAFKIARQYHQQNGDSDRYKFISRYRSYHGNTFGALAASGQPQRKYKYGPLAPGFLHVNPPDMYRSIYKGTNEEQGLDYANEIDRMMTWEHSESIAGVILEPIISGGGMLFPQDNYLKRVEEICEDHGALLIVDEVISGFGRTGKDFGFQHYGIKPDIITMAKGLTSGYLPLSATAVKKSVYEKFKENDEYSHLRHVNTFGGSPAACAVAIKNLEIIEAENLVENSRELGDKLKQKLNELEKHPNVGDIRGKGLLLGIEMVENKATKEPLSSEKVNKVISSCKEQGVIIGKNGDTDGFNNVLHVGPPLNIKEEEIDLIVDALKKSIGAL